MRQKIAVPVLSGKIRDYMQSRQAWYTREQLAITRIPAPTFQETERGMYILKKFKTLGLSRVHRDTRGNVLGLVRGSGREPGLAVTAHLDTVFPSNGPIRAYQKGNRLYGPGISDNGCGLVGLLALADLVRTLKLKPRRNIWIAANVCEEGNGDLQGMKHLCAQGPLARGAASAFIVLDGGSIGAIVTRGVGSVRYRVMVQGPGGHSFGDFGTVNPIFVMADFLKRFGRYRAPVDPKTTFNAGLIQGGTSINTIPQEVRAEVDMRSQSKQELRKLERYFHQCLREAGRQGRKAKRKDSVAVTAEKIGERPVGKTPHTCALVRETVALWNRHGLKPDLRWLSTDANVPMSLGIPAITLGIGGIGHGIHTARESYDTRGRERGLALVAELVLQLSGIAD